MELRNKFYTDFKIILIIRKIQIKYDFPLLIISSQIWGGHRRRFNKLKFELKAMR